MGTLTVAAASTNPETLTALEQFAQTLPEGTARDVLEAATTTLRSGRDVIVAAADEAVTSTQAAKVLGVSRAHLYKVLDSGALPYIVVGERDRRIQMADLHAYVAKTEELRRLSATNVANSAKTRALAIDEM